MWRNIIWRRNMAISIGSQPVSASHSWQQWQQLLWPVSISWQAAIKHMAMAKSSMTENNKRIQ